MKAFLALMLLPGAALAADPWTVVGRQGLVQVVLVPDAVAADRAAYEAEIRRLCPPVETCFVNFYAHRGDAPVSLPLPDAVEQKATATYRRSAKNGVERFSWSCRFKPGEPGCF